MAKSNLTFEQRHAFTAKNPVMSWSMLSTWRYDKEQWYQTYVLGKKQTSAELTFGKLVADSMETDMPLCAFTRLNVKPDGTMDEHEFDTYLGKIHLIGSMDTFQPPDSERDFFCGDHYALNNDVPCCVGGEFKTGVKPWDQKRVNEHGQLTFYTLCLWLQDKIHPDTVHWFLDWCPTQKAENGDFYHVITFVDKDHIHKFWTKRTMVDVLTLAAEIKKTHKEMVVYAKNHK